LTTSVEFLYETGALRLCSVAQNTNRRASVPKILAVDDSATMRRIYQMTFIGQDGAQVVTAESGDAGLKALDGADLVICDLGMPGMSGYDFARAARNAGSSAPILILGSEHNPIDADKVKSSGADDSMLKPFETQALIDKAKDLISRPRAGAVAAAPRPAAPVPAAPVAAPKPAAPVPAAPAAPRVAPTVPGVVAAKPAAPAPAAPVAAPVASANRATASFGAPAGSRPPATAAPAPAPAVARPAPVAAPAKKPALELAEDEPMAVAPRAVAQASAEMQGKLQGMGLTPEQIDGVLALSREVIERVVWEVVPDLAQTIIREEIKRLTS
jgi:CheY-like chemotaxis protein